MNAADQSGPRHVVVHMDAVEAAHASLDAGLFRGGRTCDDGDLVVVENVAGRLAFLVSAREQQEAETALATALSREPGPAPAVVCAVRGSADIECFSPSGGDHAGGPISSTLVPSRVDAFDRVRSIFETDALSQKSVGIIGLGSGGGMIARELAMSGVGRFVLVDHDRLEVGNVSRHECGLRDVGRLKVNAIADRIIDRNPGAELTLLPEKIGGSTLGYICDVMSDAGVDLVIGATDNRESRLLVNRLCMLTGLTGIFAGVFRRAYGGEVLRVVPGLSPCYQCFLSALPAMASDQEISTMAGAAVVAYSDRPVAVEPGLFSDIAPVALMVVKLAILELVTAPSTLDTLRSDLVAPLYLWINRRETGTEYESLPPMETGIDGLTVLRWYGIALPRRETCAVCGDQAAAFSGQLPVG